MTIDVSCKWYKFLLVLAVLLSSTAANATHLVGGSMSYQYLGLSGGQYRYRVTLTIYRDCRNTVPGDFDNVISIGFYEDDNIKDLTTAINFNLSSRKSVNPSQGANCPSTVDVCIEEGIYTSVVSLPASNFGYHLLYSRCCRNNSQINIFDNNGQSYYAFIPPTSTVNSSPTFSDIPAPYICANDTTTYLNKAIDPDGDSLTYKLVRPWAGGTSTNPSPDPSDFFAFPADINYRNGFSATFPFGNSGISQIDQLNGLTTMLASQTGLYSVAMEVTEWRNGVVLSVIRRDVQIIVISCPPNSTPSVSPLGGSNHRTITAGETVCFSIIAADANTTQRVKISARGEVFGDDPTWQGPKATFKTDSSIQNVTSQFCWTTSCDQGRTNLYNFVVDAVDDGCPPKTRSVTFTIEVKKFVGVGAISGKVMVCERDTGVIYTVTNSVGHNYKWSVIGGAITGSDTLTTVKVNWGNAGTGKLRLIETSAFGCVAPQREYLVEIGAYPVVVPLPNDTVCEFTSKQYPLTPVPGSTYQWLVQQGGTLNSLPQPHIAQVDWGSIGTGAIAVIETTKYGCVADTLRLLVNKTKAFSDSIYGSQSVCPFIRGVNYSAYPPRNESVYQWFIEGGTIVDGNGTDTITVDWGGVGMGKLKVLETTKWGCSGDTVVINVVKNHVLQGFKPVGRDTMCEFTGGIRYEVVKTKGSDYFWSINGGSIIQDDTTYSIIANWGKFGNAQVSVFEISYDSINNIPCIGAPVALDILLNPIPTADEIVGRFKICEGETNVAYTLNGFAGSTYKWFINGDSSNIKGQGTNTIRFDATTVGLFTLAVIETSKDTCVGVLIDSVLRVTPKPKTKPIRGDTIVCYPSFNRNLYYSGGNEGSTFNWFMEGGTIDSGNGTKYITVSFSGQKYNNLKVVEITDEGCIGDTMRKNVFADRPYLTIKYVTVGFPDDHIRLAWQLDSAPLYAYDFAVQRRNAGTKHQWKTVGTVAGTVNNFTDTNINTDNNPYEYRIRGKNLCGGEFYSPVHVNVWVGAEPPKDYDVTVNWTPYVGWDDGVRNYEVYRRNDAELSPVFSRNVGRDTTDMYADGLENYLQRYRVVAYRNSGKSDTAWSNEVEVKLIPIVWIPNSFTPNIDGVNPQFLIVSGSVKTFEMDIYDRWGRKLFTTSDISNSWDGTINGVPAPDGVYVYTAKYSGADNIYTIKSGSITLLR